MIAKGCSDEEFFSIHSERVVHITVSEVDFRASTCKLQAVMLVFSLGSLDNQKVWLSFWGVHACVQVCMWVHVHVCMSECGSNTQAVSTVRCKHQEWLFPAAPNLFLWYFYPLSSGLHIISFISSSFSFYFARERDGEKERKHPHPQWGTVML